MKRLSCLLLLVLLVSCQSEIRKEDLNNLNGYWEIKQVTLANGETKDYKVNETIDFIELKENAGFRQKVMPQFDGTYKTNGIKEKIKVYQEKELYVIESQTSYGKFKEQILALEDSTLVLKNNQNLIYTYKKFKPFSLK